jgi:type I restriction enzyme, S subunit
VTSTLPTGWKWVSLEDIADVRLGRQRSPKNHTGDNMKPYLRAANVTWGGLDLSDVKEMNFTRDEVAAYRLHPGDIVVAEASGSASEVGKPAMWNGEIDECCFQNTLIRVRSGEDVSPDYLLLALQRAAILGEFARASLGVGIHHLGAKRISRWQLPLPPTAEQLNVVKSVGQRLAAIDGLRKELVELNALAEMMARSVFHRALLGQLVPGGAPQSV